MRAKFLDIGLTNVLHGTRGPILIMGNISSTILISKKSVSIPAQGRLWQAWACPGLKLKAQAYLRLQKILPLVRVTQVRR